MLNTAANEYRNLPLSLLTEFTSNPRHRFEDGPLQELAQSIRVQGVLSPLLVRPVTDQSFEIVAGARRLRAAQLAEAEAVPVRIINLSDAEALEAQLIENLQRRDVHPLEEAQGFRALLNLEEPRYSIEQVAAKVGKAPSYVAQRLRLTELVEPISLACFTVLLDLLQIVCAIVLAVTLYRLSKTVDATVALIAMAFRFGEGLLGFLPLLSKLDLMKIATVENPPCTGSTVCLAIAGEVLNRPDDLFGQVCFVVGGFLFACLLLVGRLIPRWMAWTGVITIGLQLLCVPLYVANLLPGKVVNWLWFPILLYEIPLDVWLICRGVRGAA